MGTISTILGVFTVVCIGVVIYNAGYMAGMRHIIKSHRKIDEEFNSMLFKIFFRQKPNLRIVKGENEK